MRTRGRRTAVTPFRRRLVPVAAGAVLAGVTFGVGATPASGQDPVTFVVDTHEDHFDGDCTDPAADCTLRAAMAAANGAAPAPVLITFDVDQPVEIAQFLPSFGGGNTITIEGDGAASTILEVTAQHARHFLVDDGTTLEVRDLTLRGGRQNLGSSIWASGGATLDVRRAHFEDNSSMEGGGGAITIDGASSATVVASTFVDNRSVEPGSAIEVLTGSLQVLNSTFTGNESGQGGAIAARWGDVDIAWTTLSGNVSGQGPGSLWVDGTPNGQGAGTIALTASILEGSQDTDGGPAPECELTNVTVGSGGHNVVADDSCGLGGEGDLEGVVAGAQALADNGGPTLTMALLEASPAVDLVPTCEVADQRGLPRSADGAGCDAGAYELQVDVAEEPGPPPTAPPPTTDPQQPPATPPAGPDEAPGTPVAAPATAQPTFTG